MILLWFASSILFFKNNNKKSFMQILLQKLEDLYFALGM